MRATGSAIAADKLFAISSGAVGTEIRMKQPDGSNHLCREGAPIEKGCPAGSHGTLRAVLATMEGCRATLAVSAEHETADLLLMAILQLRMRLEGVSEAELKLLCESIAAEHLPTEAQLTPEAAARTPPFACIAAGKIAASRRSSARR